jgi:small conductance mechanosensitive channel
MSLLDGRPDWPDLVVVAGVALVGASCLSALAVALARRLLRRVSGQQAGGEPALPGGSELVLRVTTFVAGFLVLLFPLLRLIGVDLSLGLSGQSLNVWLFRSGLRIVLIVGLAWLVVAVVSTFTRRLEAELSRGTGLDVLERTKRAQTLGRLVRSVLAVVVVIIAGLMALGELDVDIMPMLAGAGIAGVALGFGAQWLVRDLIAGFFLIMEDHVRVGDVVAVNGVGGEVEAINLRTVILRDVEGVVHVFPNGAITTLANRTKDYSYYLVDLDVDFEQDTDEVVAVLREVGAGLQADPVFADQILEPLEVLGVDAFRDRQVTVRARIKTVPRKQWDVGRELRRRLRQELARRAIRLPVRSVLLTPADLRPRGPERSGPVRESG